jgi:hypothetical protein
MIPTDPMPHVANMTLKNYTLRANLLKNMYFSIIP